MGNCTYIFFFQKKMLLQIKSPASSGDESEVAIKSFKKKMAQSR